MFLSLSFTKISLDLSYSFLDINECDRDSKACWRRGEVCVNLRGSYRCKKNPLTVLMIVGMFNISCINNKCCKIPIFQILFFFMNFITFLALKVFSHYHTLLLATGLKVVSKYLCLSVGLNSSISSVKTKTKMYSFFLSSFFSHWVLDRWFLTRYI